MSARQKYLGVLVTIILIGCANVFGQAAKRKTDPVLASLGRQFTSSAAQVNGTTLHYVRGGSGAAVVLLHGFPEDWSEYRKVMPRLAQKFTVIAVDLCGIGGSAATPAGLAFVTIALAQSSEPR